jgi:hypothetical protein
LHFENAQRSTLNFQRPIKNDALDVERWTLDVCSDFMAGIVVKPRARILHGHDWVFSSEVLKVFGKPADGDVISLKDGRDRLIGSAIYNSKSQIVARRFSRQRQDLDLDFFKRRIAQAAEYRARRHVDPKLCRVVWSESDGLPGVIIDRYGDNFVLQTLTLAKGAGRSCPDFTTTFRNSIFLPVRRRNALRYFAEVFRITFSGHLCSIRRMLGALSSNDDSPGLATGIVTPHRTHCQ